MRYIANRRMWLTQHAKGHPDYPGIFVEPGDEIPHELAKESVVSCRRIVLVASEDEIPGVKWTDRLDRMARDKEAAAETESKVAGPPVVDAGLPAAVEAPAPAKPEPVLDDADLASEIKRLAEQHGQDTSELGVAQQEPEPAPKPKRRGGRRGK